MRLAARGRRSPPPRIKAYNARPDSDGVERAPRPIRITVLIDGIPEQRTADGETTIDQLVADLLPDDQKARADEYQMYMRDGMPLEPGSRLADDGVSDGDVLALTKRDGGGGGGGACSGP